MSEDTEKLVEVLRLFVEALDNAVQVLRRELGTSQKRSRGFVKEKTYNDLKWDPAKGEKLGDFEIAYKANNESEKWSYAFEILRSYDATIKNRYHGPNYVHGYWLYGQDKIYRKKLKEKTTQ